MHWQTNLYLAVIIRDYLRFFIRNTLAIGNCVFESDESILYGLDDVQCSYYMKKWEARVNMVADSIPHGHDVWKRRKEKFDLTRLDCYRELKNALRLEKSIGTLGGGNHFIEIDIASDGTKYLVIHSGSRNLGLQVANYYQQLAIDLHIMEQKIIYCSEKN